VKIHTDTLTVLKQFSRIHKSITVPVGNVLTTITPLKTIVARASTPTSFERRFTVYDLDKFLGVVSLFNDPDFLLEERYMVISDAHRSVQYTYADENVIKTKPPVNPIAMPSVDAKFNVTSDNLRDLGKALGVLGLPHVRVLGSGGKVYLQATDTKNPLVDKFSIRVGEADSEFEAVINKENLNLFPSDYEVSVTRKGMVNFSGKLISYWIALEEDSKFGGEEK
jgi:gp45 sliding clamp